MDYSIVIPVFNKAELTRHCLATLPPTIEGCGQGEVIVIDNASSDHTPEVLSKFPWVRVIRNEENFGFAGACNQGARLACGKYVIHLNNDTEAKPGWLRAMLATAEQDRVGAVGARLLFPNGTLQHAGAYVVPYRFGQLDFGVFHLLYELAGDHPGAMVQRDVQVVTGACILTPRELFLELGGFDEIYWNGYEDVDLCFKIGAAGYRVVYEPRAVLIHFESQSGVQRTRKLSANISILADRWRGKIHHDQNELHVEMGMVRREMREGAGVHNYKPRKTPEVAIVVHGAAPDETFMAALHANHTPISSVQTVCEDAIKAANAAMRVRGDRYLVFVDARSKLKRGWLDHLVAEVEWAYGIGAATAAPELPLEENVSAYTTDARCTLLALRHFPQHEVLDETFPSLDGALADFLLRRFPYRLGVRGAQHEIAELPPPSNDTAFEGRYGEPLEQAVRCDMDALEAAFARVKPRHSGGLASIVMLSWNAPQFTKLALESIRAHTKYPYEIIIVDNGSEAETTDWLRTLTDAQVIFNPSNRGFAHGCNQGIAAASGDYVVLLNNDVVVTDGWLENLIAALERDPALGVTSCRSNRVAGNQQVVDAVYNDLVEMQSYADRRRRDHAQTGYLSDRVIGLCLCIDRVVLEQIGGIDERFGMGNFEDDDFCMRVRAAGYKILVCNDVFIHHFGSQSFAANKVDYSATMYDNWKKFAEKYNLPPAYPHSGYVATPIIAKGFDPDKHFFAIRSPKQDATAPPDPLEAVDAPGVDARFVFAAAICDDADWTIAGNFLRKFIATFTASDRVALVLGAFGQIDAALLEERVNRAIERGGISGDVVADIVISDETSDADWVAGFVHVPARRITSRPSLATYQGLDELAERSPSALRRLVDAQVQRA